MTLTQCSMIKFKENKRSVMTYLAQSTLRETNNWSCEARAKNADSMAKWKVKSLVLIN